MSLKDELKPDLDNIFINLDDFATLHRIEGKTISVVMDDARLNERYGFGVDSGSMFILGKGRDFPLDLPPGRLINVDGREMIVVQANWEMGLLELTLRQNISG